MNEGIELCGIKVGSTFDENKFVILNKEIIPGGDYMITIKGLSPIYNKYFKNINVLHTFGGKEIKPKIINHKNDDNLI